MDRVYQSNAVETPPDPVASSGSYPTAGSKVTGQVATVPGPYWFYSITEEIRNALVAAGIEPDPLKVDQLAQLFKKTVRSVNHRLPGEDGNVDNPIKYVGDEWHSFVGQIPVGGVPYCGQIVTRSTYADLWEYAQNKGLVKTEAEWQQLASSNNGNVPFYSNGDGSTTFRMPKIVAYIRGASSQSESGSYVAEGLPNIRGSGNFCVNTNESGDNWAGAFSYTTKGSEGSEGDKLESTYFDFNAAKSNAIYGNSSHVTPETAVVLFGVYAFGEVVNSGSLDAAALANGLAMVETRLENCVMPYEAGDIFHASWWGQATLTGSKTNLCVSLPLSRPTNATSFSIEISNCSVRQSGAYLAQNITNMASYLDSYKIQQNALELSFVKSGGWGGTNNDVVAFFIDFVVTFK